MLEVHVAAVWNVSMREGGLGGRGGGTHGERIVCHRKDGLEGGGCRIALAATREKGCMWVVGTMASTFRCQDCRVRHGRFRHRVAKAAHANFMFYSSLDDFIYTSSPVDSPLTRRLRVNVPEKHRGGCCDCLTRLGISYARSNDTREHGMIECPSSLPLPHSTSSCGLSRDEVLLRLPPQLMHTCLSHPSAHTAQLL